MTVRGYPGLARLLESVALAVAYLLVWLGTLGLIGFITVETGPAPVGGYIDWFGLALSSGELSGWGSGLRLTMLEHVGCVACIALWAWLRWGRPGKSGVGARWLSVVIVALLTPWALGGTLLIPSSFSDLLSNKTVSWESVWEADLAMTGLGIAWVVAGAAVVGLFRRGSAGDSPDQAR